VKKANTKVTVDRFVDRLQTARSDWASMDLALQDAKLAVAVRRRATAASFLAIAVAWEGFMTEWWVAAANRDPSTLLLGKEQALRLTAVQGGVPKSLLVARLFTTTHPNVEQVGDLLGADRNLTFRTHASLQKSAKNQLGPEFAAAVKAITTTEWQHADFTRLARNALAHQSAGAWNALNDHTGQKTVIPALRHVRSPGPKRKGRALDRNSLPLFLHSTPTGLKEPRLLILSNGLESIANRLK
jgi:hypothetical protein